MSFINTSLIAYVLKASLRDKLILSVLILTVIGICMSIFIGSSAVTEPNQAVLTFIASSVRLIGVLALVLFTVFYVRRSFDTHDVEYLLSRPVTRISFVTSHLLGLSILCLGFVCAITLVIYLLAGSYIDQEGLGLWSVSLAFEFIISVHAAFFFSMVLSSAVSSTLATFAGYVLARMSGQVLGIIDAGTHGSTFEFLSKIMEASSIIVPRFDLYTQSSWLIYGPDSLIGVSYIIGSGIAFSLLIMCASIFDLLRREF